MKKIFIYYSLSGNWDRVANYLKSKNIDIRKIKPVKELPNNMVLRILSGGFLAGINHKDKLYNFDENIQDYDEIIIGSPIWNGKLSCPINTALEKLDFNNKKMKFILYSGSGTAPKAEKMLNKKYKDIRIINLKEPALNEFKNKLEEVL